MDSRAKQRLTGAIILAALFVLLVPELLTGPKSTSAPVAPAEDEGLRSYTIDIDGKEPSAAPAATNPIPAASVSRPNESAVPGPVPNAAETEPEGEPDLASTAPPQPQAAEALPRAAPAAATSAPAAGTPAPGTSTPAQAPTTTTSTTQAPRGSFVVQLGSFGSRDNADRLVRDMSAKGFKAFIAPIRSGGRELYRVRVGPTRDRASAEALAADLKRAGQAGSIVPIS